MHRDAVLLIAYIQVGVSHRLGSGTDVEGCGV